MVAIFTFMAHWNDFLTPLIYLNEPKKQTLAIAIRTWEALRLQAGAKPASWNHIMAVSVLMTAPPMLVFSSSNVNFI